LIAPLLHPLEELWGELWVSLASLLRSYTAAHGLHCNRTAEIEQDEERITARHGDRQLELRRQGASIHWQRSDGSQGVVEMSEAGRLRSAAGEEEMDMAAEAWARELMQ